MIHSLQSFIDGQILLVDKPVGFSSFYVVKKIRWHLCQALGIKKLKVGHSGTLDPFAEGLLILCSGKATKQISQFLNSDKEYISTFKLGAKTDTYDSEGIITLGTDYVPSLTEIQNLINNSFTGEIMQTPPIFSAIKKDGKRAYESARAGEKIEMAQRKVTIYEYQIISYTYPHLEVRIKSSKGTYIRSLANDLGEALGCSAYCEKLKRTKIGDFLLVNALSLDEWFAKIESLKV
jgi:tRNA pseudouridine55 synthase